MPVFIVDPDMPMDVEDALIPLPPDEDTDDENENEDYIDAISPIISRRDVDDDPNLIRLDRMNMDIVGPVIPIRRAWQCRDIDDDPNQKLMDSVLLDVGIINDFSPSPVMFQVPGNSN
jgi:hypothetical protein